MTLQEFKDYYDSTNSFPPDFPDFSGKAVLSIIEDALFDLNTMKVISGDNCPLCGDGFTSFSLLNEQGKVVVWTMLQKPKENESPVTILRSWLTTPPSTNTGPWDTVKQHLFPSS